MGEPVEGLPSHSDKSKQAGPFTAEVVAALKVGTAPDMAKMLSKADMKPAPGRPLFEIDKDILRSETTATLLFGRHKGKTLTEIYNVDKSYLTWMLGESWIPPELKSMVTFEIDRRKPKKVAVVAKYPKSDMPLVADFRKLVVEDEEEESIGGLPTESPDDVHPRRKKEDLEWLKSAMLDKRVSIPSAPAFVGVDLSPEGDAAMAMVYAWSPARK
jgi:hypothetical protein